MTADELLKVQMSSKLHQIFMPDAGNTVL